MTESVRKIIHIDMDAFYAAVAQRDDPALRGKPVAVGGTGPRGVLMTASYEARPFGVHSAMPTARAVRACPDLIVVRPDFEAYRTASQIIRKIFENFASEVEPLSLDEAFLDVGETLAEDETAKGRAQTIRERILDATGLPSSAGVSYNKFLAKIASNLAKPNGVKVIRPDQAMALLADLPIEAFHGIGPATAEKLRAANIIKGADLQRANVHFLEHRFGRMGLHYHKLANGIDDRPVSSHGQRKSVSVEETFPFDIHGRTRIEAELDLIIGNLSNRLERAQFFGHTLTMKMRAPDFSQSTRSMTTVSEIGDRKRLKRLAQLLLERFDLDQPVRLLGLGVSNERTGGGLVQLEFDFDDDDSR